LNTDTFLTRITAPQDEIVICTRQPLRGQPGEFFFWNRGSFTNAADAAAAALKWDAEPETTVYYTVGRFAGHTYVDPATGKTKHNRKQEHATFFKALAVDLDVGPDKPYATQKEGWTAMSTAIDAIGMPPPMVVSSGRGVHIYWPLTEPLPRDTWVKVSTALRHALHDKGVVIDTTKIHDPSMVLRPVGTHHKKQTPWLPVELKRDCPDYDLLPIAQTLSAWAKAAPPGSTRPASLGQRRPSTITASVLNSRDVLVHEVGARCAQVGAILSSGGVTNAAGMPVEEPLWRLTMGLAKHATEQDAAIIALAGQHPDFDLHTSQQKMDAWTASGPPTCAAFEQLCASGCQGCPHQGKVKTPASLSMQTVTVVAAPPVAPDTPSEFVPAPLELPLPRGYVVRDGVIYEEVEEASDSGGVTTEYERVCSLEMHITGVYRDSASGQSAFRLMINYTFEGWVEEDHVITVLAAPGKDFSAFLLHRQVYARTPGEQEKIRKYLMEYLKMVQAMAPSGQDYQAFGWQPDGSFLCGERVIGSNTGVTDRRLKGPAGTFSETLRPHGDRDEWIAAMAMLNNPGTETIRSAVLIALSGMLGGAAGNASMVLSIYSTETTTGKSLALIAANSLIGSPKKLMMNKNDTANAMFKVRGVLNNLPCSLDELTSADEHDVVNLVYDLSQGREKMSMTRDRELRDPVKWDGPTLITTNVSLHQKFDVVQTNNDPLKARTMELAHHDRTFIQTQPDGSSNGYKFFDMVQANNGWAYPELVEQVIALGGPDLLWRQGEAAFTRKFNFLFEPQERFYRTAIIAGWIVARLGNKLGLLPFDVDGTAQHLIEHVKSFRKETADARQDVFDTVGQFLQEHNDRLIVSNMAPGDPVDRVRQPAPERAVARLKLVSDTTTPVCPGSSLSINLAALRTWLGRTRDGVDRVIRELEMAGALVSKRERVSLFKGCGFNNPGQAHCVVIDMTHPRFMASISAAATRMQSPVALSVLQGKKSA
jgi:hypothetical protein